MHVKSRDFINVGKFTHFNFTIYHLYQKIYQEIPGCFFKLEPCWYAPLRLGVINYKK